MEKTDEVYGDGDEYTTEFRQYDPRVGRWMSLDPLMDLFPDTSPFNFVENDPVNSIDPDGLLSMDPGNQSLGGKVVSSGSGNNYRVPKVATPKPKTMSIKVKFKIQQNKDGDININNFLFPTGVIKVQMSKVVSGIKILKLSGKIRGISYEQRDGQPIDQSPFKNSVDLSQMYEATEGDNQIDVAPDVDSRQTRRLAKTLADEVAGEPLLEVEPMRPETNAQDMRSALGQGKARVIRVGTKWVQQEITLIEAEIEFTFEVLVYPRYKEGGVTHPKRYKLIGEDGENFYTRKKSLRRAIKASVK